MYHAYTNNFQTSSILSIMLGCNSHVLFILLLDFSHLSWKYSNKSCFVSNTQSANNSNPDFIIGAFSSSTTRIFNSCHHSFIVILSYQTGTCPKGRYHDIIFHVTQYLTLFCHLLLSTASINEFNQKFRNQASESISWIHQFHTATNWAHAEFTLHTISKVSLRLCDLENLDVLLQIK